MTEAGPDRVAEEFTARLAARLKIARGARSLNASGASGVAYRTIARLESASKERVDLSTVYLLCLFYRVSLRAVLRAGESAVDVPTLGTWPVGAPSLPALDAHIRATLRSRRIALGLSSAATAERAGLWQEQITRLELGRKAADVVLLERVARALATTLADCLPEGFTERRTRTKRTGDRHGPAAPDLDATATTSP